MTNTTQGLWPDCMIRTSMATGAGVSCKGYGALMVERDALLGLLDQIETIAVNDKSGCLRCTEIVNLIHWSLRPDSALAPDQPKLGVK